MTAASAPSRGPLAPELLALLRERVGLDPRRTQEPREIGPLLARLQALGLVDAEARPTPDGVIAVAAGLVRAPRTALAARALRLVEQAEGSDRAIFWAEGPRGERDRLSLRRLSGGVSKWSAEIATAWGRVAIEAAASDIDPGTARARALWRLRAQVHAISEDTE